MDLGERADDLRLGDYNGDGKTDVFYVYARRDADLIYRRHLKIYPGNGNGKLDIVAAGNADTHFTLLPSPNWNECITIPSACDDDDPVSPEAAWD